MAVSTALFNISGQAVTIIRQKDLVCVIHRSLFDHQSQMQSDPRVIEAMEYDVTFFQLGGRASFVHAICFVFYSTVLT